MPLPLLGRAIAGLAEAVQIRLRERDDVEHLRSTVGQLAQALSAIGQLTADQSQRRGPQPPAVMMPPGLVNRVARYLEASAAFAHGGVLPERFDPAHADQLAATFAADAANLRSAVSARSGQ